MEFICLLGRNGHPKYELLLNFKETCIVVHEDGYAYTVSSFGSSNNMLRLLVDTDLWCVPIHVNN